MRAIIIIPARLNSTRLPGKVLAMINGRSILEYVHSAAVQANVGPVIVATDHLDIFHKVKSFGGIAHMTGKHESGTDRCGEALHRIGRTFDVVINLQCDIPNILPQTIRKVADLMEYDIRDPCDIGTLICRNPNDEEMKKNSVVKATGLWRSPRVLRVESFSRRIKGDTIHNFEHVGIYAYRREALERILSTAPCQREISQSLEQLRAMELGYTFDAYLTDDSPISVDTLEDLERARKIMG